VNIALCSCFQNSETKRHLSPFFSRIAQLVGWSVAAGDKLRVICSEGDSTDDTRGRLAYFANVLRDTVSVEIVDGGTGSLKEYGHVVSPSRFQQFAYASNAALAAVRPDDDVVIVVESDLIWSPAALHELAVAVHHSTHDFLVAPIPLAKVRGGRWRLYDTWAFRAPGQKAFSLSAYGPWPWDGGQSAVMDSVGSCLVMPADFARTFRMTDDEAVVGFCRQVRAAGCSVIADGAFTVEHP
jgi:hypothetical protein